MSEWISVKNQSPQPYEYSLVYANELSTGDVSTISIARFTGKEWEMLSMESQSNAVAKGDLTWFMYTHEITHWMPLPKPPVDDKM